MNLKKCQVFTPQDTVVFMLDKIGYMKNIVNKKIVDFSCGDGSFLVEIAKRLIIDAKEHDLSAKEIISQLEENIYGYEIDQEICKECIVNLNNLVKANNIHNVCWNVHCANGLNISNDNQFDFIVGNPPYISYKNLSVAERNDVRAKFSSCRKGKFDYSYAFIEKGIDLLKSNAKMIIISPSNMFKAVFGRELRKKILSHIVGIIDCSKEKIFDKVLISPAITIYEKNNTGSSVEHQDGFNGHITNITKSSLENKWAFEPIIVRARRFGNSFIASNSIATLLNEVYIHNVGADGVLTIDNHRIEDNLLRIAKSPKSEYYKNIQKIIFPYKYDNNNKVIRFSEKDLAINFPNAYYFLKTQRPRLEQRNSDKNALWFEFGRSQALSNLNQEKLMISSIITDEVRVYRLSRDEIPYSGIYIIPKDGSSLEEAYKILKSPQFFDYVKSIGTKANGNSLRISSKDIENYTF